MFVPSLYISHKCPYTKRTDKTDKDPNSLSQHSVIDRLAAVHIFTNFKTTHQDFSHFKMLLLKTILILMISDITIPVISGLPNIVFILLDDVDIQLTGLKVC